MVTVAPKLLTWARSLQGIAQSGLAWDPTVYDAERYEAVRGIAAEMLSEGRSDVGLDEVEGLLASQVGHATPKLDIRGAVFRDDAILLVQEAADGGWSLPGGWVDVGESPSEAVVREVLEESGYRTRATKLIALYERDRHAPTPHVWHIWKAVILCELLDDEQEELSVETIGARFFGQQELASLDLHYSRATQWHIDRCFAHHENPDLPADFD
jgi:ADP-ribose pyrophosphatase YjhB (NUDIX family)